MSYSNSNVDSQLAAQKQQYELFTQQLQTKNALMPVVDKIEAQDKVNIQISCYGCEISDRIMMNTRNIVSEPIKEKKITAVWTAVVNYLKNKKD